VVDEIEALRREVCALHAELPRHGLVAWTSGNLSARVPGEELMVIKASGIPYEELTPEAVVVCDLQGALVEGDLTPSSDAAAHGYIYRQLDEIEAGTRLERPRGRPRHPVGGVAHTHSAYATAWAARGEAIPCVLTAMADEFGGEIPIAPFARIGDEEIGRAVVQTLAGHRSQAVLLRSHGVFTIGPDARAAIKTAVMCEDVARTVHLARALGDPIPLLQEDIDALHDRYQNVYGQR
jgi:L-ribulose-5-phosphate 4-epimerase